MKRSESRREAAQLRRRQIRSKAMSTLPGAPKPMFVVDVMLGRLARWLRIAGFDALYSNQFTDDELVALSRTEGRILLSRDTRLLVRKAVQQFIFLESEDIQSQIRQVFAATHTTCLPDILTRCLTCNDTLMDIARDGVRERVPPYVFATQARFKSCPTCLRIYWAGTHRRSVLHTLSKLLI
jgi:uncharacterized protein with PIN domain